MSGPNAQSGVLSEALKVFSEELLFAKYCLDTYKIVGLNADHIHIAKTFYGHLQRMSHLHAALSLAKLYERETSHELWSIAGICRLINCGEICNHAALDAFTKQYGVDPTGDWLADLETVRAKQGKNLKKHISRIRTIRNTRLAHLAAVPSPDFMPSVAAFEALLQFAFDLYAAIRDGYENVSPHRILQDNRQINSLVKILNRSGVEDVKRKFPDI